MDETEQASVGVAFAAVRKSRSQRQTAAIRRMREEIEDLEDLVTELLDKLETAESGRYRAMVESIRVECDFPADKVRKATG